MPQSTRCSVCTHNQISAIDAALAGGKISRRQVAKQFGLDKDAVMRHVNNGHMTIQPEDLEPLPDEMPPRERLMKLIKPLEAHVLAGNSNVQTVETLRKAYNDLAKLDADRPPEVITINEVDGLADLLSEIFKALQPFPEARRALSPVIQAWVEDAE